MQYFDRPSGRSRIALRGSSSRAPTAEELLATAKRKREQRALSRKQHAAAKEIQALYRSRAASFSLANHICSRPEIDHLSASSVDEALVNLVLLAGLVNVNSNSVSESIALVRNAARDSRAVPRLAARLAHTVSLKSSTAHTLSSRYPAASSALVVKATTLMLATATHTLRTSDAGRVPMTTATSFTEETFVAPLISAACAFCEAFSTDSLEFQAKWAFPTHLAQLLRVILARGNPPPQLLSCLSQSIYLTLSRATRVDPARSAYATRIRSQLTLSLLSIDGVVEAIGLKSHYDAVSALISSLSQMSSSAGKGFLLSDNPDDGSFLWDVGHAVSEQPMPNVAILLSNTLHLFDQTWSQTDSTLHWAFISSISSLIHALPKDVLRVSMSDDDDLEDSDADVVMQSACDSAASEGSAFLNASTLRAVVARVNTSLDHMLAEDSVRKLFAAAVSDGHHAVLHLCDLFNFLTRRDAKLVMPLRNALSLWRVSFSKGSPHVLASLWRYCITKNGEGNRSVKGNASTTASQFYLREDSTPILYVFASTYANLLYIQDADEMLGSGWPFAAEEMCEIASILKQQLFSSLFVRNSRLLISESEMMEIQSNVGGCLLRSEEGLLEEVTRLLSRLHAVDSQRRFTQGETFWEAGHSALSSQAFLDDAVKAGPEVLVRQSRLETSVGGVQHILYGHGKQGAVSGAGELLRVAPYLVPFSSRSKIFQSWIAEERDNVNGISSILVERTVSVRRQNMFDDAFNKLNDIGEALRGTIRVKFIDEHGMEEAGIDGGGMFKEFMYEVLRLGFSPYSYGMFKSTPDGRLYPNPDAPIALDNFKTQFAFLGRLLGKAVFDAVLVDIPLAKFFRLKMLGEVNYPTDLASLDPELYKNMKYLKSCPAETVEALGLNFTVVNNAFGIAEEIELIPNGRNIPVTASNRIEYIHRLAHYRMNKQIKEQSDAFLQGFYEVVPAHFIRLFSHEELQLLISGKGGKIDIDDWRRNTRYSGGYGEDTPVIRWFWTAVSELTAEEQARMLQFVTSCPRAPLLGFAYLVPGFCIHRAEGHVRLPTASTCMNLLKLPSYKSLDVVREKLKYALQANAGFDLS